MRMCRDESESVRALGTSTQTYPGSRKEAEMIFRPTMTDAQSRPWLCFRCFSETSIFTEIQIQNPSDREA